MNILLFTADDLYDELANKCADDFSDDLTDCLTDDIDSDYANNATQTLTLKITGERFTHLIQKRHFQYGDSLRVGEINGRIGTGRIVAIENAACYISCTLDSTPPKAARASVVLALPRPKMLKRILIDLAMVGIKHITIINSYHVQKSYWQSPLLSQANLLSYCQKGLEQACDTVLPSITLAPRFKPFVEDELTALIAQQSPANIAILAQPNAKTPCPQPCHEAFTVIVGPENGFTPYEVDLLCQHGAQAYTLGERHLRVETACNYLLGRLL